MRKGTNTEKLFILTVLNLGTISNHNKLRSMTVKGFCRIFAGLSAYII